MFKIILFLTGRQIVLFSVTHNYYWVACKRYRQRVIILFGRIVYCKTLAGAYDKTT